MDSKPVTLGPVWRQGWCLLTDIEHYKRMLTRIGLLRRIHEPSAVLKSQERAIQQSIAQQAAR